MKTTLRIEKDEIADMIENIYFHIRGDKDYNSDDHSFDCKYDSTSRWSYDLVHSYNILVDALPKRMRNQQMRWFRFKLGDKITLINKENVTERIMLSF